MPLSVRWPWIKSPITLDEISGQLGTQVKITELRRILEFLITEAKLLATTATAGGEAYVLTHDLLEDGIREWTRGRRSPAMHRLRQSLVRNEPLGVLELVWVKVSFYRRSTRLTSRDCEWLAKSTRNVVTLLLKKGFLFVLALAIAIHFGIEWRTRQVMAHVEQLEVNRVPDYLDKVVTSWWGWGHLMIRHSRIHDTWVSSNSSEVHNESLSWPRIVGASFLNSEVVETQEAAERISQWFPDGLQQLEPESLGTVKRYLSITSPAILEALIRIAADSQTADESRVKAACLLTRGAQETRKEVLTKMEDISGNVAESAVLAISRSPADFAAYVEQFRAMPIQFRKALRSFAIDDNRPQAFRRVAADLVSVLADENFIWTMLLPMQDAELFGECLAKWNSGKGTIRDWPNEPKPQEIDMLCNFVVSQAFFGRKVRWERYLRRPAAESIPQKAQIQYGEVRARTSRLRTAIALRLGIVMQPDDIFTLIETVQYDYAGDPLQEEILGALLLSLGVSLETRISHIATRQNEGVGHSVEDPLELVIPAWLSDERLNKLSNLEQRSQDSEVRGMCRWIRVGLPRREVYFRIVDDVEFRGRLGQRLRAQGLRSGLVPTAVDSELTRAALLFLDQGWNERTRADDRRSLGRRELGIEMIQLPGGTALQGNAETEPYLGSDEVFSACEVEPFEIATTEVTIGQFWRFLEATDQIAYWNESIRDFAMHVDCPATRKIDWFKAVEFCNWLSRQEGVNECYGLVGRGYSDGVKVDASANGYRLPTRSEWEYACRSGSIDRWHGGDDPSELKYFSQYFNNSNEVTWPVGSRAPNAFGLFDMHGNVYEWCQDVVGSIDDDGYGTYGDPKLWVRPTVIGVNNAVTARGGDLWMRSNFVRSSREVLRSPDERVMGFIGFRIARSLPASSDVSSPVPSDLPGPVRLSSDITEAP